MTAGKKYIGHAEMENGFGKNMSGLCDTKEEVIKWGTKFLGDHPNAVAIVIFEAIAAIERESPPIRVRSLVDRDNQVTFPGSKFDGAHQPAEKPAHGFKCL